MILFIAPDRHRIPKSVIMESAEGGLVESTSQIIDHASDTQNGTSLPVDLQTNGATNNSQNSTNSLPPSTKANTNNTNTKQDAITEANVNAEVDRILNLIDVNSFMRDVNPPTSKDDIKKPLEIATDPQPPPLPSLDIDDDGKIIVPPVTSILAELVTNATPAAVLNEDLRGQLYECMLDYIGVTAAGATIAPSSEPIFKAITAFTGLSFPSQPSSVELTRSQRTTAPGFTVLTKGQVFPKPHAALLNATFGHSLDFDDTHAESSLHAGVTAISTVLAEAESNTDCTSDDALLAIILAYEITIRIGIALSTESYTRGFHMTSTAGIFGAVAAICKLRRSSKQVLENAWGLAGSKAAGSMQYLSNGSHNKRLHPGFAVHDAFLCVALAEAGVLGADKIIEGELGLLQAYTDREREDVDWKRVVKGLGREWEFSRSALKPFAGCRMTHGFIELADSLGKKMRAGVWNDSGVMDVKRIRCSMPKNNMILIGQRTPNKVHPENMVDAQFSCYFQVANAFLYGMSHDLAAYDRLKDQQIWDMCEKVDCVVDSNMKEFACRIDAFFEDGNGEVADIVRREVLAPLGEKSHPFERKGVEKKFCGLMEPIYGEKRSREVMSYVEALTSAREDVNIRALLDMIAWSVKK